MSRAQKSTAKGGRVRQERSETRRAELVRVAYRQIVRHGLEGFRTRQVAEAAGIDTGTLHYHFPSKEAIVQAVVEHVVEDLRVNRARGRSKPRNAREELRNEIQDVAERVRNSPEQFRVLLDLRIHATRNPPIATMLTRLDAVFHSMLAGLLTRGIEEKVIRGDIDVEAVAGMLRLQLIGLSSLALQKRADARKLAGVLLNQLELGLRPG